MPAKQPSRKKRRFIDFIEQTDSVYGPKQPLRKVELQDPTDKGKQQQDCEFFITEGNIHQPEQLTTRSGYKQWLQFLAQQRIFVYQHPEFREQLRKWQSQRKLPDAESIKKLIHLVPRFPKKLTVYHGNRYSPFQYDPKRKRLVSSRFAVGGISKITLPPHCPLFFVSESDCFSECELLLPPNIGQLKPTNSKTKLSPTIGSSTQTYQEFVFELDETT